MASSAACKVERMRTTQQDSIALQLEQKRIGL